MGVIKKAMTGADAAAEAMRQINPDVVAAYPITPQTPIMHRFAQFVAEGKVKTEFVTVESEHSAMSACVGAATAGGRVMTATSANGLALMFEIVYIAASNRLPIVMNVVNRALSGPINIHCDHSDSMACRDSGWIQLYSENAEEVYENNLIAIKLAERVNMPVMVCQDGFITSHSVESMRVLDDASVRRFIGQYKPKHYLLDVEHPITSGPFDFYDYYFEHKRQQIEAMTKVIPAFYEIVDELGKLMGKHYETVEEYYLADAEFVVVSLNSTAGTVKHTVDELRKQGKRVGALKIRLFRPFPREDIAKYLRGKKAVAVLDRAATFGHVAPLYHEIRSALYEFPDKPRVVSYIYGLGGRDVNLGHITKVFNELESGTAQEENYLGVRDEDEP
ncbi:pyruvate ferredoxin oxidoreductase [Candidatus Woesearchaeota archaeon]|nr:MAG: pyruvate ferredoxin oxidoreductase [Candidatus Woesearchaeota archaeon]